MATLTGKVLVKTWCRVCGMPQLLEVVYGYETALGYLATLDDQPMICSGGHDEPGGWGVHWRMDEVLSAVFPGQHSEDIWLASPWYEHTRGQEHPVVLLTPVEARLFHRDAVDHRRDAMSHILNINPKTRDELEIDLGEDNVWDADEFEKSFDVLGFRKPYVMVRRRADGVRGTAVYQRDPVLYFAFDPSRVI